MELGLGRVGCTSDLAALLERPPWPYGRLVKAAPVQSEQDYVAGDILDRLLTEQRCVLHRNLNTAQRLLQHLQAYGSENHDRS